MTNTQREVHQFMYKAS